MMHSTPTTNASKPTRSTVLHLAAIAEVDARTAERALIAGAQVIRPRGIRERVTRGLQAIAALSEIDPEASSR